jgi:hypothetical protein
MVKRTEAEVISASLFQLHKAAYHINDVDAGEDLLYSIAGDQKAANIVELVFIIYDENPEETIFFFAPNNLKFKIAIHHPRKMEEGNHIL